MTRTTGAEPRRQATVRLPVPLMNWLEDRASAHGWSVSAELSHIIAVVYDRHEVELLDLDTLKLQEQAREEGRTEAREELSDLLKALSIPKAAPGTPLDKLASTITRWLTAQKSKERSRASELAARLQR